MPNIFPSWVSRLPGLSKLGLGAGAGATESATSIYFSGSAVALATGQAQGAVGEQAGIVSLSLRADPMRSLAEAVDKLTLQVDSLGLRQRHCQMVLAPELYALSLMERPAVADDEVVEAVRWRMQEGVDFAMESASLDVFELPDSASRGKAMVFVAALPTDRLKALVDHAHEAGLTVDTVDIAELSLRNVVHRMFPTPDQNIALLRVTSNAGMINISRGDELFLSRRMAGVPGDFSVAAWADYKDRLLLQVQRSIDYFESAMGQPPCNALLVATTHGWQEHFVEHLSEMLPIPVRTLASVLADEFELQLFNPEPQTVDWQNLDLAQANAISAGLPAIGGLLRGLHTTSLARVA